MRGLRAAPVARLEVGTLAKDAGPDLDVLGRRIRSYRGRQRQLHADRPWTQEDLAVAIGSDKAHVNRIECGRQRPTLDTLTRLSDALDLSWADRSRLLRLAGYLLAPPPPRTGEVADVARRVGAIIHDTSHPARLVDQESRIWDVNDLFAHAFLGYPDRNTCLADVRGHRIVELLPDGHRVGQFLRDALTDYPAFVRRHLVVLHRALRAQPGSPELGHVLDVVLADRSLCAAWLALSAHLPQADEPHYLDHQVLTVAHPDVGTYMAQIWRSTLTADDRFGVVHLVPADDDSRRLLVDVAARRAHKAPAVSTELPPVPEPVTTRTAGSFPDRPIELTVPWAAGGVTDVGARILAPLVAQELGQAVVVGNRDEAQSPRVLAELARRPGDGYHLAFINQPALDAGLIRGGHRAEGNPFRLIVNQAFDPLGVFVRDDSSYGSLRDLLRDAECRPGAITVGTSGPYTPAHLGALALQRAAGVRFNVVHFGGSMEHIARFLSGQTDVALCGSGITVPALHAGDLRALAMYTTERFPLVPDVPTTAEAGFDELVLASTRGVWVPGGVPARVRAVLEEAFLAALANPVHTRQMHASGLAVHPMTGAEYDEFAERQQVLCASFLPAERET